MMRAIGITWLCFNFRMSHRTLDGKFVMIRKSRSVDPSPGQGPNIPASLYNIMNSHVLGQYFGVPIIPASYVNAKLAWDWRSDAVTVDRWRCARL
jgi:hypothetical protein